MSQQQYNNEILSPAATASATSTLHAVRQPQLYLPTLKVISYFGPGVSGGVSASLEPVVNRLGSKVHWFAISDLPASQPRQTAAFSYYSPRISKQLLEKYDRCIRNYLWPLLHNSAQPATFDPENWKAYKQVCDIVASECLTVSPDSFPTLCWLHDYQLALTAPLMAVQAGLILSQFWHAPWPTANTIAKSPIARELVEALLTNRLLGFQTQEYALNFVETVRQVLPLAAIDSSNMSILHKDSFTQVISIPVGIDFTQWQRTAATTKEPAKHLRKKFLYKESEKLVLGVDRLDPTKGVLEKLNGLARFMESASQWLGRFRYIQIVPPPHEAYPGQLEYREAIVKEVEQLNSKYGNKDWTPIELVEKQLDQEELSAWYQAADVLAINSISEGLNLLGKEYVAARNDEQGALLLSRQAGLTAELVPGATLINPADPESFSVGLMQTLTMHPDAQQQRMRTMRAVISNHQLHDWALSFLHEAISTKVPTV